MHTEWADIAGKLIVDTPELVGMWRTLERLKHPNEPPPIWVWNFLGDAFDASTLPPYHYKSKAERRELIEIIRNSSVALANTLTVNELDLHLVKGDGYLFNGYFAYEDFGDSNRKRIDIQGDLKLKMSYAITQTAERAIQKITDEPMPGNVGVNVRAVRFIRIIAANNTRRHGEAFNTLTAAAANAIFETNYTPSDVTNLLAR